MPDLTLDFRPDLDEEAARQLREALDGVQGDDQLTIVLPRVDAHEVDPLFAILKDQAFDYQTKGGHGAEFYVLARRKTGGGEG